jgi:hypothetical protein
MYATLNLLIAGFRTAQDAAVAILLNDLQIPRPQSGLDWSRYIARTKLDAVESIQGIGIRAHGYGVEVSSQATAIDFDWGDNGEADGFDGWRLYVFALNNHPELRCTHSEINRWLDDARRAGELSNSGSLYYDPARRAPPLGT